MQREEGIDRTMRRMRVPGVPDRGRGGSEAKVPRLLTAEQAKQFRILWRSGASVIEIASEMGWTAQAVTSIRKRLGLSPRSSSRQRRPRAVYRDPTPEEIAARSAEIRARNLARKLSEPASRAYRESSECGGRVYRSDIFGMEE